MEESEEEDDLEMPEDTTKKKGGFWSALALLVGLSSSGAGVSSKKKDTGRCDGDCANCPPHYGYRHGRWYYGKDHTEGCTRGGNRGGGGMG